jgi:putative intracellular protease/amidase
MRGPFRATPLLFCLVLALLAAGNPLTAQSGRYVCDPCGLPCDSAVYDKPGTCPRCGMALVDKDAADRARDAQARKKVAILVFDGVQIIDSMGPYEVFGAAGFDVYTVAETRNPVTSAMGLTVVPKYAFSDAPQPDVLVVPGGGVRAARDSAATLKWVRDTTARAEHTLSVCNGAFILASAGLLDGLSATTTAGLIDRLRSEYPKTKVVDDRRYVDNGRIVTAGGLSSGIDGALHVVAKMLGDGTAQQVALGEEYDWRPNGGFARAALADRQIPELGLDAVGKWDVVSTQGGTDRWDVVVRGSSDLSAKALMEHLDKAIASGGKWKSVAAGSASSTAPLVSRWTFQGRDGRAWRGTLQLDEAAGQSHKYTAKISILRAV